MSTNTPSARGYSDQHVQEAVQAELRWTPSLDGAAIGVSVDDGVVTLQGEVDTYMHLLAANRAPFRVRGVTAVASELAIHKELSNEHTDSQLARSVRDSLRMNAEIPESSVTALVSDAVVTLKGAVKWDFQRRAAESMVSHIEGVRRVDNLVELLPRPSTVDAADQIRGALARNALLEAKYISVTVKGTTATLTGAVRSAAEKAEAALVTWGSPHITAVRNLLHIVQH